MANYIALLRKGAGSNYGVDFPGCVTPGRALDEAHAAATGVLELHVARMIVDGDPLPEPSSLDTIMGDPDHRKAVAFLVAIPARPAKSVRINIMLPDDWVTAIDRATNDISRFLAAAARPKLRSAA